MHRHTHTHTYILNSVPSLAAKWVGNHVESESICCCCYRDLSVGNNHGKTVMAVRYTRITREMSPLTWCYYIFLKRSRKVAQVCKVCDITGLPTLAGREHTQLIVVQLDRSEGLLTYIHPAGILDWVQFFLLSSRRLEREQCRREEVYTSGSVFLSNFSIWFFLSLSLSQLHDIIFGRMDSWSFLFFWTW